MYEVYTDLESRIDYLTDLVERVEFEGSNYADEITDETELADVEARLGSYAAGKAESLAGIEALDSFLWGVQKARRHESLDTDKTTITHDELRESVEEARTLAKNLVRLRDAVRSLKRLYADGNPNGYMSRRLSRVLKDLPRVDDLMDDVRFVSKHIEAVENLQIEIDKRYFDAEASKRLHERRLEEATRFESLTGEIKAMVASASSDLARWGSPVALNPWTTIRDRLRIFRDLIAENDRGVLGLALPKSDLWSAVQAAHQQAQRNAEAWAEGAALIRETRALVASSHRILSSYVPSDDLPVTGFPDEFVVRCISCDRQEQQTSLVLEIVRTPSDVRLLEVFGLNAVGSPITRGKVRLDVSALPGQWVSLELLPTDTALHGLRVQGLRLVE